MIKNIYRFLNPRFQNLFSEYKVDFKPRYGFGLPAHPELLDIISQNRSAYFEILSSTLKYKEQLWQIPLHEEEDKPYWINGYLPGLDIIMLYSMVAELKPTKYIEVGSGHSTRVVGKAIKDFNLRTKIISIDPEARANIDTLAHQIYRQPLESLNLDWSSILKKGDMLFIDNSHRILPNSDAMVFFMEVLPRLQEGVIIHMHDIYLPYDYPAEMCDRFYSEQYGLACYLLANPSGLTIISPNYYISEDQELKEIVKELWTHPGMSKVERHGGSFWAIVHREN